MKISFNEATALECSTLEQDLVLCDRYGFDYIEIRDDMLIDYLKSHSTDELKAFFDTHRVKPHAINALYSYSNMFLNEKSDDKERTLMADFLLCCEVASKISDKYFIIVPPYVEDWNKNAYPDSKEKVTEDCVRILRRLSDIVFRYDINLCFEPVGNIGFSVRSVEHAWEIVKAVDRSNVGLTFDSFNLYANNKLNDFKVIQSVDVHKIFAVHVNNADDYPIGVLDRYHRRFVDTGVINIDNFIENLRDTGYDGMVSIETFRPEYYRMKAEDLIKEAYNTTKALVDRILIQ